MADTLIQRLRAGATKSINLGTHLHKYQALCDEAADLIERLTTPVEGLETTAEARAYLADFFDAIPPEEREDTWTARFVGRALLRDHATLTARLAAAEAEREEEKTAREIVVEQLLTALRTISDERTAREALEGRVDKAATVLREQPGYTVKIIAEALAILSPEPEGTVEEPPRDNSITDAW